MAFWELLALVVSGAGTLASVLGVFFAVYARQNGRATREFIAAENQTVRQFMAAENQTVREFMAAQNQQLERNTQDFIAAQNQQLQRDMREFLATLLERLDDRISREGEKTRQEIRKVNRSAP